MPTLLPPEAGMRVSSLADVGVDPLVIPHTVAELAPPEPSYKITRVISNTSKQD